MASFSDQDDDYLIELIIQNPPLYDARLKSYKDNIVRENIWELIAKKLNKTSDDCKKRWKCIRDSYTRIKRKNKLPTGSAAASKSKKWPLLERLNFLETIPKERKTICNTETHDDVNNSENEVSNDENCYNNEGRTNKETPVNKIERNREGTSGIVVVSAGTSATEVISNEETGNDDEMQNKYAKQSTGGVLKKKKQSQNSAMQMALLQYWKERDTERRAQIQALTSQSTSIQEQEPDMDGIKSFCSHVGTMLGKLTPALRVQAKTKVFNIFAKYELISLNQSSSNSSNGPLFDQNSQFASSNPYSPISSISSPNSPVQATNLSTSNTFNFSSTKSPVQATDLSTSNTFNLSSPVQATNLSTPNTFNLQSNYYENMSNIYYEQTDINNSVTYLP